MLRPTLWINAIILFLNIQGHSQHAENDNDSASNESLGSLSANHGLVRTLIPPRYGRPLPLNHNDPVAVSQRRILAEEMKRKYNSFRRKVEQTAKDELQAYRKKKTEDYINHLKGYSSLRAKQPTLRDKSLLRGASHSRNYLNSNSLKQLRSAGEAPGRLRLGSLPPAAHPVLPQQQLRYESLKLASLQQPAESGENVGKSLLDKRLGPSAPANYDPSIVVDFSLLKLAQAPNKRPQRINHGSSYIGKTIILTSRRPSFAQVASRDVGPSNTPVNSVYVKSDVIDDVRKLRAPEEMSVYISTSALPEENKESEFHSKDYADSEYGPHSGGNDPNAGIPPSEITFPEMPLEQLDLPQSVRDSLRKYLQPLLVALTPLTKSVPGLPGLDYPILSVVPYTNFYCSNMPWPGFYADTEARCQTWHACDVDGRQSTFLCPNGTVFNQALMVCDWWYNSDCLTAPFLYSLNERLFGNIKEPQVLPYRRITPELLDTIFI